jgi:Protein of unknown function (DUF551).
MELSNEEAIEILYRELGTETEDKLFPEVIEARDMAIKALEDSRWIPVTERLPEDEVDVLIYTTDKKINKAYRRYKPWTENQMEWIVFETLGFGYIYDDDEVLEWMPLPKHYERSEEE